MNDPLRVDSVFPAAEFATLLQGLHEQWRASTDKCETAQCNHKKTCQSPLPPYCPIHASIKRFTNALIEILEPIPESVVQNAIFPLKNGQLSDELFIKISGFTRFFLSDYETPKERNKRLSDEKLIEKWELTIYFDPEVEEYPACHDYESLAVGFFMANGRRVDEAHDLYQKCLQKGYH